MDKAEIAQILEEIATLLELKGENPFRVRAYRNGARALLNMDEDLEHVIDEKRLTEFEGIGDHLAQKITILYRKKRLPYYEKLKKSMPPGVLKLLQVQGLGPKKVIALYKKLKIKTIADLKKAAESGRIGKLKGFGKKTEQNILGALASQETYQKRRLWWSAMEIAKPILEHLKKIKGVKQVELAGSMRRCLETIGDLDILASTSDPKPVMKWFTTQPDVAAIISQGEAKSTVRLKNGMQVDLRVIPDKQFAPAFCYFTGSKQHNIKIRERSLKRGWSLSEYGFEGKKKPAVKTEADIYKALGLSYIPPELREDSGEIAAAEKGTLPKLIEVGDIRGTLHNHTTASDGRNSLREMIEGAEKMGWEYVGISDHSKSSFQANGLDAERLFEQIEEIRKLKTKIHVFAGTECDILADGSLDFPDRVLKKLDFVIASVHSSLQLDEKAMTKRIIKAVEHPLVTMIGHVTGRLLLKREAYKVNVPKIIDACIANKKIIELNGNPMRLDMDWRFWRSAARKGLRCCINVDAHAVNHYQFIQAGINAARKGWLEKKDVINTLSLAKIKDFLLKH